MIAIPSLFLLAGCEQAKTPDNGNEPEEYEQKPLVEWPSEDIDSFTKFVTGYEVKIPAYEKAYKIELDTSQIILEGYFGIYCWTEIDSNPEETYINILKNEGWEVESEKSESFYNAYDADYQVWLNFGYDSEIGDFEIYVTKCDKTKWPAQDIANYLQSLVPGTTTAIPKFEAYTYVVSYYDLPSVHAIAINAYGFKDTILEDYKQTLTDNEWSVLYNDTSFEWNAFSKAQDVELHFYIDNGKNEFNVDIFRYNPPVKGWPYEEIAQAIEDLGATGEILPFTGEASGFRVDYNSYYFAIFITCPQTNYENNVKEYNQMLENNGYVASYEMMGETFYAYPGTTLAYHATVLLNVFQIETMMLREPAK